MFDNSIHSVLITTITKYSFVMNEVAQCNINIEIPTSPCIEACQQDNVAGVRRIHYRPYWRWNGPPCDDMSIKILIIQCMLSVSFHWFLVMNLFYCSLYLRSRMKLIATNWLWKWTRKQRALNHILIYLKSIICLV